jgi:hypothetical protein
VAGPLICGIEVCPTVTVFVANESHPKDVVSVTVIVLVPAVFQSMFTLVALLAPTMVPPVTVHRIELLEAVARLYVLV